MLILSIIFMSGALAMAEAPKADPILKCDANNYIKNACDYFERNKDKPEFVLPDGTKFKNPRAEVKPIVLEYSLPDGFETPPPIDDSMQIKSAELTAEFQLQMAEAVRNNPKLRNLPERTKVLLLDPTKLRFMPALTSNSEGKKSSSHMILPWPLDNKNAPLKTLDMEQASQVRSLFTPAQLTMISNYDKKISAAFGSVFSVQAPPPQVTAIEGSVKPERRARLAALVQQAKDNLIAFIKQNKNDKDLSEEQKALIEKIQTVKYEPGDSALAKASSYCASDSPNAFYRRDIHTFTICDNFANSPDSDVISTIGHELGHAIDPCRSEFAVYRVNPLPATQTGLPPNYGAPADSATDEDRLNNLLSPTDISIKPEGFLFASDLNATLKSPATVVAAEKSGRIEKLVNGVPISRHPFEPVRACMVNKLKFVDVNKRDIDQLIGDVAATYARREKSFPEKDREWLRQSAETVAQCWGVGPGGKQPETNEGMSDVYGSAVLSQYLQQNPAKTMLESLAANSAYLQRSCQPKKQKPLYETANETISYYRKAVDDLKDRAHPMEKRRIQTLALQFPGVAKGLGCSDNVQNECFKNLKVPVANKNQSSGANDSRTGVQ